MNQSFFEETSHVAVENRRETACDGNCGCVVPCPSCKGHHHRKDRRREGETHFPLPGEHRGEELAVR